ncbi:hypothetical protein FORC52_4223 [Salmonella enterica subsp. enterica serovar Enteritidis]|uniref:Uncharacterized protein n=6 Tax=Salmonella enterica I TaxID=59201 RepID=M7RCS3_SALDU|nr:hypothetical protein SNSL254_A4525 [Salmonella enterica subsp. enterica serovar Newport str. SL254]ACF69875.1 hypothetical protein SeHA_C4522 [Salmonella enterica subsp. enterica serovar Heidelberg str. SL476]ACH76976.1 hypothetical protein SeD_A4598 [Salmonella enterica subsp. enterica serovar Dublin str. CT_02021853]AET56420.1 hypothetical protein SPUL_4194 [Salmonella enterica subsp. enterica serovar Gallinarum/Pullorum str. RKS5078]AEZ47930.1 hypothetical protein STBHUCCB_43520 [Salmonel
MLAEKRTTGNMRHVQLATHFCRFAGWRRKRLISLQITLAAPKA